MRGTRKRRTPAHLDASGAEQAEIELVETQGLAVDRGFQRGAEFGMAARDGSAGRARGIGGRLGEIQPGKYAAHAPPAGVDTALEEIHHAQKDRLPHTRESGAEIFGHSFAVGCAIREQIGLRIVYLFGETLQQAAHVGAELELVSSVA